MKRFLIILLATTTVPGVLSAGELPRGLIEMPSERSRWSLGASFAPLLNVKSDFSGLGAFAAPFAVQPIGGGQNYEYEDGFVRVDSSGNAGNLTTYWGYDRADQYDAINQNISFNLTGSLANGRAGETEEYSPGFEIFGYYDMGKLADLGGRSISWGFKGGLHYARVSTGGSGTLTTDILRTTDTFDASGVFFFPPAGYAGTPNGPGFLLGDDPTRTATIIANGGTITSDVDLDVDLVTLAAGPYLQFPVSDRFHVAAEAGVSVSIAHGDYEFDTLTTITGLPAQAASGGEKRTVILPGFYAGVSAAWQLTDHFGLHASARYQYIDQFSVNANGSNASLSFDGAAIVSFGGVWKF